MSTRPPTVAFWVFTQILCQLHKYRVWSSDKIRSKPYEHNNKECQCAGLAKSSSQYVDLQIHPCFYTHTLLLVPGWPSFYREPSPCFSFAPSLPPTALNHSSQSLQHPSSPDTANFVFSTRELQTQWWESKAGWKGGCCVERNDAPCRLQSCFFILLFCFVVVLCFISCCVEWTDAPCRLQSRFLSLLFFWFVLPFLSGTLWFPNFPALPTFTQKHC